MDIEKTDETVADLQTTTDVWDLVEGYLSAEHLELDDLEVTGGGRGRTMRVVVDGEAVDIDRLAELSRGISRLLDNETEIEESYQLEVTSPGLERKLRRPAHFSKSIGREVVIKAQLEEGKRTVRGVLTNADDDTVTVDGDEGEVVVEMKDVLTAKTVFRWEKAPKPGH